MAREETEVIDPTSEPRQFTEVEIDPRYQLPWTYNDGIEARECLAATDAKLRRLLLAVKEHEETALWGHSTRDTNLYAVAEELK